MGRLRNELPVAPWHRGLSLAQIKAASDLQFELSEDLQEETSYRVRECLIRLGVCTQFDSCLLNNIIQLSQGDNLAFLFFLYTMQYQSEGPQNKYTLNAQIILSAIAYLDMPATIEALEKVLPLPEKPLVKTPPSMPYPTEKRCRDVTDNKPGSKKLPYFEKQPRPKQKRKLFLSRPHPYGAGIPNASKDSEAPDYRWFADFELHPARRVVKSVISEEIVKLFDRIDEFQQNPEADRQDMCKFHQESRSLERDAYLVKQRNQCLALFDLHQERKLIARQRIAKQLQLDVDRYMQNFGNNRWSPGVPAFRQIGCTACRLLGPTPLPVMVLGGLGKENSKPWTKLVESRDKVLRLSGGQDSRRSSRESPTASQTVNYFQGPKRHAPYIFDYIGLFGRYSQMTMDAGQRIRGALIKTLGEDDGKEKKKPIRYTRSHINDAVNQCVRKIYEKSLFAYRYCEEPKTRLSYEGKSRFDPNDEVFMDRMLSDAFKMLQKNKKHVLATLPNGHQVPELREWIRRYYGKRYTVGTSSEVTETRETMYKLSEMQHELYPILMGQNRVNQSTSYAHYDLFLARARKYQLCFKDYVNEIVMERTRLCWRAMNYLRVKNYTGLQQTFFSYMPSRACASTPIATKTRRLYGTCGR